MNKVILQNEDIKKQSIKVTELDDKFHGKITIHFAHGVPKKVETNLVEEVITLS